jgi:hypothetical protein
MSVFEKYSLKRAHVELALVALAVVLLLIAAKRWREALATAAAPAPVLSAAPALPARFDEDSLAQAAERVVGTDPFRLANEPSDVRYEPRQTGAVPVTMPAAPRPTLVLKAIVGGPPWQAIVDGIAGQPGAIVRAGDTFDKLVVRKITRDTVVVQGPDTTWKLTIPRD